MSVLFDQLRISDDGKSLYIDCHVNKASYFNDLYISKLTICTEDQVNETDPIAYQECIYQRTYEYDSQNVLRELHLLLSCSDFGTIIPPESLFNKQDLSHNMFFVFVECALVPGGTIPSDTPCRLDEYQTLGVTFDYGVIFNKAMNYTRELGNSCVIPDHFIDFIMNTEALKLAIETEHFVPAIGYWKNLMGSNDTINNVPSRCGCHG